MHAFISYLFIYYIRSYTIYIWEHIGFLIRMVLNDEGQVLKSQANIHVKLL